jgi:hypothetical protein
MHDDDEPCTAYFYYPVLDCPTTMFVYKRVYTLNFTMHVLGWEYEDQERPGGRWMTAPQ